MLSTCDANANLLCGSCSTRLNYKTMYSISSHRPFGCELKRDTTAAFKGSTRGKKQKKQGAPAEEISLDAAVVVSELCGAVTGKRRLESDTEGDSVWFVLH